MKMAHSQIFTQWRQPTNECYPSEWQQQKFLWKQVEESTNSYPHQMQQNQSQWQDSDGIKCQEYRTQSTYQQQWQNPPHNSIKLQANQWKQQHNQQEWQQDQQERLGWQGQWQEQHSHTWQHHRPQPTPRQLATLDSNLQNPWHSQSNQRWPEDFDDFVDDIGHEHGRDEETTEVFRDETEKNTEERERYKRKNSEMKDLSEGYDTEEEEILPSCKRQRITVAAVERLLASFTISDNRPIEIDDVHRELNLHQNNSHQSDGIILQADGNYYDDKNNRHKADSIHTKNPLGKQILPFRNGIETKVNNQQESDQVASTLAGLETPFRDDAVEHEDSYEASSTPKDLVFGRSYEYKTNSCGPDFKDELWVQEITDPLQHFGGSDRLCLSGHVQEYGLSHTGYVVDKGQVTELEEDNSQKTTTKVKVTFPDQDEEEQEEREKKEQEKEEEEKEEEEKEEEEKEEGEADTEEEEEKHEQMKENDEEEAKGNKFTDGLKIFKHGSDNEQQVEYRNKNKETFTVQQHDETTYSSWKKKQVHKSYKQECQNNENGLRNINYNCDLHNVDTDHSIVELNYDSTDCTNQNISSINTQASTHIKNIFSSDDISSMARNSLHNIKAESSIDNTNPIYDSNASNSCNSSTCVNTSNSCNSSTCVNTSINCNTDATTTSSDASTAGINSSKRSMDGGGGAPAGEGNSQKRVRKLKSGLRLCSNITCYIEQVLYNC